MKKQLILLLAIASSGIIVGGFDQEPPQDEVLLVEQIKQPAFIQTLEPLPFTHVYHEMAIETVFVSFTGFELQHQPSILRVESGETPEVLAKARSPSEKNEKLLPRIRDKDHFS